MSSKEYRRQHYESNKALYKSRAYERSKRVSAEMMAWVNDVKSSVACCDCGTKFPDIAMDFDHLHSKDSAISKLVRGPCSWRKLFDEMLKCEIVCSNCHRVRTAARLVP